MNVILIGYRGCGKTTLGRMLADETWAEFADVDDEVCKRFNNDSIAAIWEEHGEPAWRAAEVEVTRDLVGKDSMVIGLGGGTLMEPGARVAVEQAEARRVYLKCAPEVLHARIEADGRSAATRPSLTAHGGGLDEIKAVLAERESVYEAVADKTLDVTHLQPVDALRFLIARCL